MELKNRLSLLFTQLKQIGIAVDQLVNTLIGFILLVLDLFNPLRPKETSKYSLETWFADETLSSHFYRLYRDNIFCAPKVVTDMILFFDDNHCEESYLSEIEGRQLPPEMRHLEKTCDESTLGDLYYKNKPINRFLYLRSRDLDTKLKNQQ